MAETNVSKEELQAVLKAMLEGNKSMADAIRELATRPQQMNPMEEKKYAEEIKKGKRRELLAIELGKAEAQARWNKQQGCSHCRYPASAGKMAGSAAPRGQGEWATGGQVHSVDGTISLICMRCGTHWRWMGTPQERDYAENAGLLGFPPPPVERCINAEDFVPQPEPRAEKIEELKQAAR